MPAPSRVFPIQQPLRNKEECQYARNLIGYCFTEYVKEGERLVITIDRQIETMSKKQPIKKAMADYIIGITSKSHIFICVL